MGRLLVQRGVQLKAITLFFTLHECMQTTTEKEQEDSH